MCRKRRPTTDSSFQSHVSLPGSGGACVARGFADRPHSKDAADEACNAWYPSTRIPIPNQHRLPNPTVRQGRQQRAQRKRARSEPKRSAERPSGVGRADARDGARDPSSGFWRAATASAPNAGRHDGPSTRRKSSKNSRLQAAKSPRRAPSLGMQGRQAGRCLANRSQENSILARALGGQACTARQPRKKSYSRSLFLQSASNGNRRIMEDPSATVPARGGVVAQRGAGRGTVLRLRPFV